MEHTIKESSSSDDASANYIDSGVSEGEQLYGIDEEAKQYLLRGDANKWRNKQRTLVLSTRRIIPRYRHLMNDIRKMLPHHKPENKWERKQGLRDINEMCEMKSCNNAILLETRKASELYMWVTRAPNGPSAKFQVLNVHTMGELKMTGNCLLHSRPLLSFDNAFATQTHLKLIRELFIQTFGTPRNHPLSKPFYDHMMCFFYYDDKIWFRHYQISQTAAVHYNNPAKQELTEIGPRFVLDPIKIFDESFGGQTIWQSATYMSPAAIRSALCKGKGSKYANRVLAKSKREKHKSKYQLQDSIISDDQLFRQD